MEDLGLTVEVGFESRADADKFANAFSRRTYRGHTVTAVKDGKCSVIVGIKTKAEKKWLNEYVDKENQKKD